MLNIEKALRGVSVITAALFVATTAHATTITLGAVYPGSITGTTTYSTNENLTFKFTIAALNIVSFTATGTGGNFPTGYTETVSGPAGTDTETFGPFPYEGTVDYALTTAPVPEPASWAMMLVGLGAIGFVSRRRALVNVSYG